MKNIFPKLRKKLQALRNSNETRVSRERVLTVHIVNRSTQKLEELALIAPSEHKLDIYQSSYPLYD